MNSIKAWPRVEDDLWNRLERRDRSLENGVMIRLAQTSHQAFEKKTRMRGGHSRRPHLSFLIDG
jgi:hypothetical protein